MGKLSTPDWINEGYDSKEDYEKAKGIHKEKKKNTNPHSDLHKGKTFRMKKCPGCGGTEVEVILSGEEGKGSKGWGCKSCKWAGKSPEEKEMSEDEFMGHLDKTEETRPSDAELGKMKK